MGGIPITTEQAINGVWNITALLVRYLAWTWVALAHVALLALALLWLWAAQITPEQAGAAFRQWLHSSTAGFLAAAGVSALTLIAGYWRLAKFLHGYAGRWLVRAVTKGL